MLLPDHFSSNSIPYIIDVGSEGHLHGGHVEAGNGGVRLFFSELCY